MVQASLDRWFLLLIEASANVRDGSFLVVGVVGAEADEYVHGTLPVLAGMPVLVQGVVGVSDTIVSAGLVGRLP